MNFKFIIM